MLFSPPLLNLPLLCYHTAQSGIGTTCKTILLLKYRFMHYCRRPEEPAILGLLLRMIEMHRPQSGHSRLGPLSREVTQSIKSQSRSINLARTPYLLVGSRL